jgi:hypothetical protein
MTIEFRKSLPPRDWIVLSGMSLPCVLGLHDWERRGPQALVAEVGMALDLWGDTGGSQFFITHSPQPHLDGGYTVFGQVVNGMDVVDRIRPGDTIERVEIWTGR